MVTKESSHILSGETIKTRYTVLTELIGNNWKIVEGKREGQTQVSWSQFNNICKWSYPVDIHLSTAGIQGWPKIYIEVYHLDWLGRAHLFGYGIVTVPTSPGTHTLDCYTWRPFGSLKQRFIQYFLGGGIQLKYPDQIFSPSERYKLSTETMGVVSFELTVLLRNFTNYGVEYD
ncbi:B9 domain-containing protein 2 isoform X2 [Leptinotarsa decemlineata]|uniref:B9 domain-containing protein 2 isoform X2 n=1 Tax=Leptinotarsa decemlineata TaxID=7539 RepID=UPI003D305F82